MKQILVTGATGNVGMAVVHFLTTKKKDIQIIAGVRNIMKARTVLKDYPGIIFRNFDLEKPHVHDLALEAVDTVFLVRPPHLSDVPRHFEPLLKSMKNNNIREVMFLSVQGAERSRVIPHHKIEKLILKYDFDYIFLRPGYFMQNLTTTLHHSIVNEKKIVLPAGEAKFNWIDVENIGELGAELLTRFEEFRRRAYDVTGYDNLNFNEVTDLMNEYLPVKIEYKDVNPVAFYRLKKREGMPRGMRLVMIMLHFLPRYLKEPVISGFYEKITGKRPTTLREFVLREKNRLAGGS